MQLDGSYVVCNGEIYGFEALKRELLAKGYSFQSESDCEVLLPLYREHGTDMFRMLDAEFALILYDAQSSRLSPPATPSASVRCTTATTMPAPSSSPASRKTLWALRRDHAVPSRTLLRRTESSSAIATSPP